MEGDGKRQGKGEPSCAGVVTGKPEGYCGSRAPSPWELWGLSPMQASQSRAIRDREVQPV